MNNEEIIGGVSPLKKKRQSKRGGEGAGKATRTAKQRGGFAKSRGKRGGGGRNVGGYNVQTRFRAGVWTPPASGGTSIIPSKPYSYGDDGELKVNDPKGGEGVEKRTIPGTEATKGNEFADNCYGAAGERLEGTSYYSEIKGMNIACKWGGKSDGSFEYDKEGTPGYDEQRTYKTDPKGEIIADSYSEWEKVVNKNK